MALVVGRTECQLCSIEVTVGEEVPAQVIEIGNTLCGRVVGQKR